MRSILFFMNFLVPHFFQEEKLGNVQKNWSKMTIFQIFGSKSTLNQVKIDGF